MQPISRTSTPDWSHRDEMRILSCWMRIRWTTSPIPGGLIRFISGVSKYPERLSPPGGKRSSAGQLQNSKTFLRLIAELIGWKPRLKLAYPALTAPNVIKDQVSQNSERPL